MRRLAPPALLLTCAWLAMPAHSLAAETPKAKTLYRNGPSGRYLLGGTWHHRADPTDQGLKQRLQRQRSLAGWSRTTVPRAVNAGDYSNASYMGTVHWFRKDFKAPDASQEAKWILRFESVNYRAKVWLNGKPLGANVGSYLPFELRAKAFRTRGANRLVVRVDGRRQKFDIPPLSVRSTGSFEGGWWNYTGILREVYLRKVTNLDFESVFVSPRLRCPRCAARVTIEARVTNLTRHGRRARIVGSFGGRAVRFKARRVGGRDTQLIKGRVRIGHPRLWWPDRPTLTTARLSLMDQGRRVVQRYTVHTGIRMLRVNSLGRVELNGRELNLRGASIHEDSPSVGAALGRSQMRTTMGWLRRLGADMTRSHYPLHPYFLELCDRNGILVWSEIPVFRMRSTLFNVAEVRQKALRMLRNEIVRDRNHPSVFVWSLGNENASRPKRGLQTYIRRAERTAKELDSTRLLGLATSGFPTVEKQDIYTELDVLGVNDYFGWYGGPRGSITNPAVLDGYLDRLHSDYPNQAIVITEFGAEANRAGPAAEKGTYEFQTDFLKYHLGVFATKPFVSGALIWNLRDFRVKPGWAGGNPLPHPPVNEKGLVDDSNRAKPAFGPVRDIYRKTGPYR